MVARPGSRFRLPLFPLPVVLLPGAVLPLHIFEQRYRDMLRDCLASDRRFGMIYHDWDRQGPFLNEEGGIGCIAEIREHEALEDGRSLIVVEGMERFRIEDGIELEARYFEALVSTYQDEAARPPEELIRRRESSVQLFRAVVEALAEREQELPELRTDCELSFQLAQTIQVDAAWHQGLLELRDETERLARLDSVFRAVLR